MKSITPSSRPSVPHPPISGVRNAAPALIGLSVLVGFTAFVAVAPVVFNGFIEIYDDGVNFLTNASYRGLGPSQIVWAWTTILLGSYQPLGWMLFEVEYAVWGLAPWGYHLVSAGIHGANAVVLFWVTVALLRRINGAKHRWDAACAALAAAGFAAHPLRVETVAWASSQPYLPSTFFALVTVLTYLHAHPAGNPLRRKYLIAAWLSLVTALSFKSIPLTIPVVLALLDIYPLRRIGSDPDRSSVRSVWREKLPFFALTMIVLIVASVSKGQGIRLPTLPDGVAERVTQASFAVCFYLTKTAWPFGLSADYPLPNHRYAFEPVYVGSFLLVVAITTTAILFRRWRPGAAAAWFAYLVMLAPTSGLARTNAQIATDRYSYLPTTVVAIVGAYALSQIKGARPMRMAILASGAVVVAWLTTLSWAQCRTWHDDVTLFQRAVRVSPDEPQARVYLGSALERQGRFAEAEAEYVRATELDPGFSSALNNLGILRYREQRFREAKRYFREAARIDPTSVEANTNVGLTLASEGDWNAAIPWYETALRLSPHDANSHRALAESLEKVGRFDEGIEHLRQAYLLAPLDPSIQKSLQEAIRSRGSIGPGLGGSAAP